MGFIINIILGLICAATISSCSAMTPQQQEEVDIQLSDAAWIGDLPAVQQALAAGANIHMQDDFALRWAAGNGHLAVVQFLVEHGADIHALNDSALRLAALKVHLPVLQYLLELPEGQRADIHADNDAALQLAASQGHLPLLQFLVEHGADIHARNDYALQLAAEGGHWAVVAYLLQQGANRAVLSADQLNLLNKYLLSELAAALSRDYWHKVEELLSAVPVQELPHYSQQEIKNLLVPAVQKKLNSAGLVLPITTIALRTLSFIVGPHTRAAFIYFIKEDTHEITQ